MDRSTTSLRSHTAVASGFLHKLTHGDTLFARWHQRYYVLCSDGLLYSFKSSRARLSNRVIPLGRKCLRLRFGEETRRDEWSHWPKDFPPELCFSIVNSDREFHFCCDSEKEFVMWRDNLFGTLDKLSSAHNSFMDRGSKHETMLTQLQVPGESSETSSLARTDRGLEQKEENKEKRRTGSGDEGGESGQEGSLAGYDTVETFGGGNQLRGMEELEGDDVSGSSEEASPLQVLSHEQGEESGSSTSVEGTATFGGMLDEGDFEGEGGEEEEGEEKEEEGEEGEEKGEEGEEGEKDRGEEGEEGENEDREGFLDDVNRMKGEARSREAYEPKAERGQESESQVTKHYSGRQELELAFSEVENIIEETLSSML